jgi:EEF1A lysine methyltransferase 2
MVGLDYSNASIRLAKELGKRQEGCQDIKFSTMDVIRDDPRQQEWWLDNGFDLVIDKGTFDAISLCEDVIDRSASQSPQSDNTPARIHTVYPSRVLDVVKPGGFVLITSCNWTEKELIHWFTNGEVESGHRTSVWGRIEYPRFQFGGHEGQGVSTVCFKRESFTGTQ